MEHVIETGGEPYLRTPEADLSFVVRNALDVYAIFAACCAVLALAARAALQLLLSRCRPFVKAWLADGSLPWISAMPKAKVN